MSEPGSSLGFALALLATAWGASAVLGAAALGARRRLARTGPELERTALGAALVIPPVLAVATVIVLGARSLLFAEVDHCAGHGDHPHLCVVHGGGWADVPAAVAIVAMVGAYLAVRAAQLVAGVWQARIALRRVAALAREIEPGVLIAPASKAFCFVGGAARPRIYVSSALWDALDAEGRAAMLAHERGHIRARDLRRRAWLGAAAWLGAPLLARRALGAWELATERARDRDAAREVGGEAVARALLRVARLQLAQAPGLAFGAREGLEERVRALLAPCAADDEPDARRMRGASGCVLGAALVALVVFADPMHHALEILLGLL